MQTIIALAVVFIVLLMSPIVGASIYYKTRQGIILHINQDRIRDARYFGKSFAAMVEKQLPIIKGDKIKLSREEKFVDSDLNLESIEEIDKLVICRQKTFTVPKKTKRFNKDIYCAKDAVLDCKGLKIRTMYCKGNALLNEKIQIVRWIDAEHTLVVNANCDLGISATAGERMSVGPNCQFHRLFSPEIRLGQYPDSKLAAKDGKDPRIFRFAASPDIKKNVKFISREMIDENGTFAFSVLSRYNVKVIEKVIVRGNIRSHKGVRLCDDAVVCGNIFADQDVLLGKNAVVLGNIFSQGNIYFEEGASAGQEGRVCSVIARGNIIFEKNNFVFGYVNCEGKGQILHETTLNHSELLMKKESANMSFLEQPQRLKYLEFKDLEDFEGVDDQGFRKEKELCEVVIPEGAKTIRASMFFECKKLMKVSLPSTIERIESYAFADCITLQGIENMRNLSLEIIGVSAFENCKEIEQMIFPTNLKDLAGAAFSGCEKLCVVIFDKASKLESIGDHCFRGCRNLEEIWIPDKVNYIGISAFYECDRLRRISVPYSCHEQPGILELKNVNSHVEIEFREPIESRVAN